MHGPPNYRNSGLEVKSYRHYDSKTCGFDAAGAYEDLKVSNVNLTSLVIMRPCRPVASYLQWYGHCQRQCIEVCSADPICAKCGEFFHLCFSAIWIDSCTIVAPLCCTFVLCHVWFFNSVTASLSMWKEM